MKKNFFDKMSDSYENFHLRESEIHMGGDTFFINPRLKLALGWSLFILCCVLAYFLVGVPFMDRDEKEKTSTRANTRKETTKELAQEKSEEKTEESDMFVPYEKDAHQDLNAFIESYYLAMENCDHVALQEMVTDTSIYQDNESLKKKAEFITGYHNITVYTKKGMVEGSYVAFVVAKLTITGVNSSPYDIVTMYIISDDQGYKIENGELSGETMAYIEKIQGERDIQDVYQLVEEKNAELKEEDATLRAFYEKIGGGNTESTSEEASSEQETTKTPEQEIEEPEDGGEPEENEE